ncbi:hypothetical protein E2C01_016662 [Portunus trituberculatus]|uniref:Uncharacterized protein n=1 Tax=Portunus trituberculatus TaxID=210409 RepID=A0A5B7DRD5_PORTR|nr:hypothetical protein [Portunus trituberculatus]
MVQIHRNTARKVGKRHACLDSSCYISRLPAACLATPQLPVRSYSGNFSIPAPERQTTEEKVDRLFSPSTPRSPNVPASEPSRTDSCIGVGVRDMQRGRLCSVTGSAAGQLAGPRHHPCRRHSQPATCTIANLQELNSEMCNPRMKSSPTSATPPVKTAL